MVDRRSNDDAPPFGIAGWQTERSTAREGNASGGTPSMHGREKSDRPVVPAKLPNKPAVVAGAEVVEERGLPEGSAVSDDAPDSVPDSAYPWMLTRTRRMTGVSPTLGRSPVR